LTTVSNTFKTVARLSLSLFFPTAYLFNGHILAPKRVESGSQLPGFRDWFHGHAGLGAEAENSQFGDKSGMISGQYPFLGGLSVFFRF